MSLPLLRDGRSGNVYDFLATKVSERSEPESFFLAERRSSIQPVTTIWRRARQHLGRHQHIVRKRTRVFIVFDDEDSVTEVTKVDECLD